VTPTASRRPEPPDYSASRVPDLKSGTPPARATGIEPATTGSTVRWLFLVHKPGVFRQNQEFSKKTEKTVKTIRYDRSGSTPSHLFDSNHLRHTRHLKRLIRIADPPLENIAALTRRRSLGGDPVAVRRRKSSPPKSRSRLHPPIGLVLLPG